MTVQVDDTLTFAGAAYRLDQSPLAPLLERHPERDPGFEAPDSALWRGYAAEWLIEDGWLHLAGLQGWRRDDADPTALTEVVWLREVFPDADDGLVRADWFTGELRARLPISGLKRVFAIERGRVA